MASAHHKAMAVCQSNNRLSTSLIRLRMRPLSISCLSAGFAIWTLWVHSKGAYTLRKADAMFNLLPIWLLTSHINEYLTYKIIRLEIIALISFLLYVTLSILSPTDSFYCISRVVPMVWSEWMKAGSPLQARIAMQQALQIVLPIVLFQLSK